MRSPPLVSMSASASTRALTAGVAALLLAACGGGDDGVPGDPDAAADADVDVDAATAIDAAVPTDAAALVWATYRIEVGRHDATISGGGDGNPVRTVTTVDGRDFQFAFNPSAKYVLTMPTDPTDQLDWNKLPGLSDCGQFDLSVNGAMFGWRWRTDLTPRILEVTAYANNNRVHLTPAQPLFTLTEAELAADAPLRYRVWWSGNMYHFSVAGMIGARAIDVSTTISRVCPNQAAGSLKWAGQFYFGGTSTAPTVVTARVSEKPFAP